MRRLWQAAFATFGLVAVIFFAILVSVYIWPFMLVPRGTRERYAIYGAKAFGWMCTYALLWGRVTLVGIENLPKKRGFLVISNHRSWADVGMLQYHTTSQGISKREVAWIPFFGLSGYLSGVIFFDRRSKIARARVVTDAIWIMKHGVSLHVFPEGTRTRTGRLNQKVFLRLVQEAYKAGIEVVPACVWGTENAVGVGGYRAQPFQKMGLQIDPPFPREGHADDEAFAKAAWGRVREMAAANGADQDFAS